MIQPRTRWSLVTAGNRITHASSCTVSFLDFTKTLFSETNHTVLSSVKSIDLFLDANGGDSGQAFRIYNNQNPDGSVTENTHIFKVAENGDVSVSNNLTAVGTVDADIITTDGISITDNNIVPSRSNDNIVPDPNGTGAVQVVGNLTVRGSISGTIIRKCNWNCRCPSQQLYPT